MNLRLELYLAGVQHWPTQGRHILAQFDVDSVVVYQAYRPAIGNFAARNGFFGGEFSYARMSWFKPNFLWMMFRSGWGSKENQKVTLAIWLRRDWFERVLGEAVPSSFDPQSYALHEVWKDAVAASDARLQFDPDHDPSGAKLERRALQIGVRGALLREYGREAILHEAILHIENISDFVAQGRAQVLAGDLNALQTPCERVYAPAPDITARLRLDV